MRSGYQPETYPDTQSGLLHQDRDGRIRTGDFLLPKQARYRAAPRPVKRSPGIPRDPGLGTYATLPHSLERPAGSVLFPTLRTSECC